MFIGTLGTLRLKIPWKKLKSEPAVISLEDLFILVSPRSTTDSDKQARKMRELKIKKRNLQLAELMSSKSSDKKKEDTESNTGGGYFSSYTSLIINNLQVYIDRVHIRYEDPISNPAVCYISIRLYNIVFNYFIFLNVFRILLLWELH